MGGSLSLYLAATPVVSRRRYGTSFVSPSRYLRPRLHWPPFVGIKIGMVVELVPQLRPGSAPRVMLPWGVQQPLHASFLIVRSAVALALMPALLALALFPLLVHVSSFRTA